MNNKYNIDYRLFFFLLNIDNLYDICFVTNSIHRIVLQKINLN